MSIILPPPGKMPTVLPQIPSLDSRGHFAAGKEKGKGQNGGERKRRCNGRKTSPKIRISGYGVEWSIRQCWRLVLAAERQAVVLQLCWILVWMPRGWRWWSCSQDTARRSCQTSAVCASTKLHLQWAYHGLFVITVTSTVRLYWPIM